MSNRRTEIALQTNDAGGHSLQATAHETDSPILPVAQLAQLHQFRPDLVNWVIKRTEAEAEARRKKEKRRDIFIFVERVGGLFLGTAIAFFGLGVAGYLALHGASTAAMVLGGATLVSIVGAVVAGKQQKKEPAQNPTSKPRRKR